MSGFSRTVSALIASCSRRAADPAIPGTLSGTLVATPQDRSLTEAGSTFERILFEHGQSAAPV
jgi:hypothetical protein